MREPACSEEMKAYFRQLFSENDRCYDVAERARSVGCDPQTHVEIPKAEDLAARVEEQLSQWNVSGVADIIRELSAKHESREEVSLLVAKEVAKWPSRNREEAIDRAVRVGLSVLTEGILVAPIVGIGGVKVGRNSDGTEYVSLFFNGPIRAAGGTGQAMSVLIADMVRREFGIGSYKPEHGEVERLKEEIPLYKQCAHLQYSPNNEEIELIYKNCPVCIDGEKTEDIEITGFRNLPRIKTNCVRGGVCLVIAEGLCQKAPKLEKHVKKLGIDGWDFISQYLQRKKGGESKDVKKVVPDYKFLKDIVGGRPVLGHPSRVGGLRLRYGRGRTTGLAALAIHPATMYALDSFLAIGTQIKIERPGKAGAVTPCDRLDGPIVLLNNGDLVQANSVVEMQSYLDEMKEIVDLGEVLLPYGEFAENNHILVPGAFSLEWYRQELLARCDSELPSDWASPANYGRSKEISSQYDSPLHPNYNLFWYDVPLESLRSLREALLTDGHWVEGSLLIDPGAVEKRTLEDLGALHTVKDGGLVIGRYAEPLLDGLGLAVREGALVENATIRRSHLDPGGVQGGRPDRPSEGRDPHRVPHGTTGEGQGATHEAPASRPIPHRQERGAAEVDRQGGGEELDTRPGRSAHLPRMRNEHHELPLRLRRAHPDQGEPSRH